MGPPNEDSKPAYSEPPYTKIIDKAKFPFYQTNIEKKLVPEVCLFLVHRERIYLTQSSQTRQLLEEYSQIPPAQQSQHVHRIVSLKFRSGYLA